MPATLISTAQVRTVMDYEPDFPLFSASEPLLTPRAVSRLPVVLCPAETWQRIALATHPAHLLLPCFRWQDLNYRKSMTTPLPDGSLNTEECPPSQRRPNNLGDGGTVRERESEREGGSEWDEFLIPNLAASPEPRAHVYPGMLTGGANRKNSCYAVPEWENGICRAIAGMWQSRANCFLVTAFQRSLAAQHHG